MELKYGFISADDHVQEHPAVWTARMSKSQWGDRIPHLERQADGSESWMVDGKKTDLRGVALAGAAMPDRARDPQRWEEVPKVAYVPAERLTAMDVDGVDYSVLYPSVAGRAGETFGRLDDPALELACVQAYNDWLIEEWAACSPRFIPAMPGAAGTGRCCGERDQARGCQGTSRRRAAAGADAAAPAAAHQRGRLRSHLGDLPGSRRAGVLPLRGSARDRVSSLRRLHAGGREPRWKPSPVR